MDAQDEDLQNLPKDRQPDRRSIHRRIGLNSTGEERLSV
jgi:hypothetical protein